MYNLNHYNYTKEHAPEISTFKHCYQKVLKTKKFLPANLRNVKVMITNLKEGSSSRCGAPQMGRRKHITSGCPVVSCSET